MEELNKHVLIQLLCHFLAENYGNNYTYVGFNDNRVIETQLGLVHDNSTIEIYAFSKESDQEFAVIKIGVQNDFRQIYIPNVFIPPVLKYNGLGKKLIHLVFKVGQLYNYEVFVVDLTEGFRAKLLRRGAVETDQYDTLQIVDSTKLI
jgi:hypothetical protein